MRSSAIIELFEGTRKVNKASIISHGWQRYSGVYVIIRNGYRHTKRKQQNKTEAHLRVILLKNSAFQQFCCSQSLSINCCMRCIAVLEVFLRFLFSLTCLHSWGTRQDHLPACGTFRPQLPLLHYGSALFILKEAEAPSAHRWTAYYVRACDLARADVARGLLSLQNPFPGDQ